jgi:hypothetical protein
MQIAIDRSSPKTSESATRTSGARLPAPLPVQRRATPPARSPAEPARATLERAFGAEFFAAPATGPSVGAGSGPDRGVNPTGIPSPVRAKMEAGFGADFSDVRVHPRSSRAAELGALAYTQGSEIHVAPGQWAPETRQGQELLGHELAHVVQQREGRVQATVQYKGVALNDEAGLEAEADAMGARVAHTSAGLPQAMARAPGAPSAPLRGSSAVVQRTRDMIDPGHVATRTPSMETYKHHVALRVRQFFIVFLKAVLLWRKNAPPGALPHLFTDHARAQAGSGFRIKKGTNPVAANDKHDAAHLTNITLMKSAFSGMTLSAKDQENLADLYRATAATTPQFQTANITADKIIDGHMTGFKNAMISDLNTGTTLDDTFIRHHLKQFLKALKTDLATKSKQHPAMTGDLKGQSYEAALEVVTDLLKRDDFEDCFDDIFSEYRAYDKYNLS